MIESIAGTGEYPGNFLRLKVSPGQLEPPQLLLRYGVPHGALGRLGELFEYSGILIFGTSNTPITGNAVIRIFGNTDIAFGGASPIIPYFRPHVNSK